MSARDVGMLVILAGVVLLALGALIAVGAFGWFGRLPGDLHFDGAGGRLRLFAPIASMLVVSLVLTLLVNVLRRCLG